MTRRPLLELDDIPEEHHYLFGDDHLGDRRKERVILGVARAREARYEWHQHVDIARGKGVTLAEMRAIGGDGLSAFDDALARRYSPAEIVAPGPLVEFYVGLCNYVAAVDMPFEGGSFVGWTPDEATVAGRFG